MIWGIGDGGLICRGGKLLRCDGDANLAASLQVRFSLSLTGDMKGMRACDGACGR